MKKLLLMLALAAAPASLFAMENNKIESMHPAIAPLVKIKKPNRDPLYNHYEIIAKTKNDDAGIVTYKPTGNFSDSSSWLMKNLRVNANYRKKGLGFKLFKACLQDIQTRGGTSVTWTAYPLEKTISESELINIYLKMIAKVEPEIAHSPIVKDVSFGTYETTHITVTIAQPAQSA